MKKLISLLLAALLLLSVCGMAFADDGDDPQLQVITCPEQDFCTIARADLKWKFTQRDGITIYTEHENSIPYVLVFRSEDWLAEPAEYIHEQYTPMIKQQYGKDLISYEEYEQYPVGGRLMAAARYTYKLKTYVIEMLRAYDVQNGHTVIYTAKYIQDQGEKTLEALDIAAAYYRPDIHFYDDSFPDRWRYLSANMTTGETVFLFDEVYLALPADWLWKYDVVVSEHGVNFFHSMSRRMWQSQTDTEGGWLFSLRFSENDDFRNLPSYYELGAGAGGYYYLAFPTDYQAYTDIESIREEYSALYSEMAYIKANARCFLLDSSLFS